MLEYEHLFRDHPGADGARETWTAQVDICVWTKLM